MTHTNNAIAALAAASSIASTKTHDIAVTAQDVMGANTLANRAEIYS